MQKQHQIEGHKARLMRAAVEQIQVLEAKAAQLMQERNELAAALKAETETVVGHPLPEPVVFRIEGDAVVARWDGEELPV